MTKQVQRTDSDFDRESVYHRGIVKWNDKAQAAYPGSKSIAIPNLDGVGKFTGIERQLAGDSVEDGASKIMSDRYLQSIIGVTADGLAPIYRRLGCEPYLVIVNWDFDTNDDSIVAIRPLGVEVTADTLETWPWTRMTARGYANWLHAKENP